MPCPLFVDYTRECQSQVGQLRQDTFDYCSSEKYKECPFYRIIHKKGSNCKYFDKCSTYDRLKKEDFKIFVETANKFCLSQKGCLLCHCFQVMESGEVPPLMLLPDGSSGENIL
ncbi:MAG: hypothetical protein JW893_02995 [Candidatus Omnitrophica bacterium]|nr:hypothetical protein [Candidatus Omnitrophota bacterium]